jgi:hypothetical protein
MKEVRNLGYYIRRNFGICTSHLILSNLGADNEMGMWLVWRRQECRILCGNVLKNNRFNYGFGDRRIAVTWFLKDVGSEEWRRIDLAQDRAQRCGLWY